MCHIELVWATVNMKVFILLCFLCTQITARSFHDELHNALHSVERGFGKLLSDVVVDVTNTLHCTISAVERVLVINGLMRNKSIYSDRCKHGLVDLDKHDHDDNDPLKNFIRTRNAIETRGHDEPIDIHDSIFKVNKTLSNALDNHVSRHKMDDISKVLKDETDQLQKVSNILRNELHSISKNIKNQSNGNYDYSSSSVWKEIESVKGFANNSKNENDPREIGSNDSHNKRDDGKTNSNVEKKGNSTNPGESSTSNKKSITDAKHDFETLRDTLENQKQEIPETFKDLTSNIQKEKRKLNEPESIFNVNNSDIDRFSPFYDPTERSEPRQKVYHDVLSIMQGSDRNDRILSSLFKTSHAATDVFQANPEMLKF